ncbi:MAG: penicillin-binding protein 2 [Deltaproteobacteria bacterium CG_4_10_14_0_2_um_filter_43_8]|nr:MAG: penicillin-binding protein 2 [Deltaproteobacteria bacterium CG11_big_fil_rev_8_21_14_0_20_42_23]PJA20615.1 MAG: penicillin-binding protein 2 [Deltaproteobacteria bacterium CG_4_10_14_0_2_um_filter_43_8]PJC65229.1 MAG: penicillin-binding protein 2 [Deltaproteobacteria bacterium CG_4_9_14_0_2_um_filter_42_21]
MQLTHEYTYDVENRYKFPVIAIVVFFLIVIARLYALQVSKGDLYRHFSLENSIKEIKQPAPRGMFFDRNGEILVDNQVVFDLVIVPQYVVDPPVLLKHTSELFSLPLPDVEKIWEKRKHQARYQPLLVKADISLSDVSKLQARHHAWPQAHDVYDLRGLEIKQHYRRVYPHGTLVSHLMGYVREINADRLKRFKDAHPGRYSLGDYVGVQGLEERWDLQLRGIDGYEQKLVSAVGKEVDYEGIAEDLRTVPPVPGENLYLTIDDTLQRKATELLDGRKGAVVLIDVKTGALRTFLSTPSYDLNKLESEEGDKYWRQLLLDESKPLLNRTIQATYPPASTYKMVPALALLSEKTVKPNDQVFCAGAKRFGNRVFHCWNRNGHGAVDLHRSLTGSCDIYYYVNGQRLGVDMIAHYAKKLGFGAPTGIGLDGEKSGLIPTSEWKLKRFGSKWQEGETLSIAIGQGYDLVTPLQNAVALAHIVNGGHKLTPYLVENAVDIEGKQTYQHEHHEGDSLNLDPEALERVKAALVGVVNDGDGTARGVQRFGVPVGGKTGTAQVVSLAGKCTSEKCKDHAWFVGFTPTEKPELAAAVIVEHGGGGSRTAAPIVGELFALYHKLKEGKLPATEDQ